MKRAMKSAVLLAVILGIGGALAAWKYSSLQAAGAAAASEPEPSESVSVALAEERQHRQATSAIGTVLALRSVTLRNELAGTVRYVDLRPGAIVEAGAVLVALDVSVEQADVRAAEAQLALATATLQRLERLREFNATSEIEVDKARAERDVGAAQIARLQAIIARKTIRVPFRARVGIADLHPGQYLNEGTVLTTLQSVDDALHVDFSVPQATAAALKPGDAVDVHANAESLPLVARVVAVDARVDPTTRNSTVRARIDLKRGVPSAAPPWALPAPGSSVRVSVGIGAPALAVGIPATALRKGPGGDHVFALVTDVNNRLRAELRPVQVGTALGDEVLIISGLKPGEQVAASGSFKLRDSALVTVASGTTASAKAQPVGGS